MKDGSEISIFPENFDVDQNIQETWNKSLLKQT